MWFSGFSSPWKFRRYIAGFIFLILVGLSTPLQAQEAAKPTPKAPVLDDSPPTKPAETAKTVEPKRYSIPKHASSTTAPRSMMEVPSPAISEDTAPERKAIVLTDSKGKAIDNFRFGFMTAGREPLTDAGLKGKARKATSELLFGNAPNNCWWDSNNLLNVEGTPLKVVFVQKIDGKHVDFELEEEAKIEKQFADQARAIFYRPQVRDLNKLADGKKIFFGVTKNGFAITNQTEEKSLQEKVYKVWQGEDASALSSEENGVMRMGNDTIGLTFYYIEQVDGATEVIEVKEPFRSNLLVAARQQSRKVLVVLREVERLRLVEVGKLRDRLKLQQAAVTKGLTKNQKKEERVTELAEINRQLPLLIASLTKIQKNNEVSAELKLAAELIEKAQLEEDALAFPVVLAIANECSGYELTQEKRTIWALHHGTPKKKIAEWPAKPVWHNCNGDTFVIAIADSIDPNLPSSHWEAFEKGVVAHREEINSEFLLTGATFFKEEGLSQSVRFSVKDRPKAVYEYTPGTGKPKIRLLVGGEFDNVTKFRIWATGGNQMELVFRDKGVDTSIQKFQFLDATSIIGNSSQFIFKATALPVNNTPQIEKYFAVRGTEVVDVSAKLPATTIARAQWLETRKVFRFDLEGDQVNHYEINASDYKVLKRLSVAEECEKSYTFTVKADQADKVTIDAIDAPKLSLEVKKIKGIACNGKQLAILAEHLQSSDKAVALTGDKKVGQLEAQLPEAESSGVTLFILKANGLVAYPALSGFNYIGLSSTKEGYQAKLKGPIEISIEVGLDGHWVAPSKLGEPFSGEGMLVAKEGAGVLFHQGEWVAATSKLTSLSKQDAVISMVADDLQLNLAIAELPEGLEKEDFAGSKKLATFDGLKLLPPFSAPLETENESISAAVLVKRGQTLWHRVWLSNNDDYGLLVSLDGHTMQGTKYRAFSGTTINWGR